MGNRRRDARRDCSCRSSPCSPTTTRGSSRSTSRAPSRAKRLTGAFKLVRKLRYVNALGWFSLYDYPASADNPAWGLLTYEGEKKPAFAAYAAVP